ncbi:MAG: hypothetical protein TU35_003745 [Thermoproteus sp. AZ2]|uniref:Uncharacterized protein n=1 Tax=Thermoproteus sp. AZ2 TaxID=1609232 RepID=A0ACC6V071_9CREN
MAKREDKRKKGRRGGRVFIIAIIAIIFAEIGWVLATSGFNILGLFRPRQTALTAAALLENTQMWAITQSGLLPTTTPPPIYNDSIIYITVAGIPPSPTLLNSTTPVYVVVLNPLFGDFSPNAPAYFYAALFNGNYTIASRYQGKVFIVTPGQSTNQMSAVFEWIDAALMQNGVTLTGSGQQLLQSLSNELPIVVVVKGGVAAQVFVGQGAALA